MQREQWLSAGLTALLIGCGVSAWSFQLRPPLAVDTSPLSRLPLQVGRWQGVDQPMEGGVAEMLAADFNLQRSYVHPVGGVVWLYVGYYGTERGGRPEHTPWACYPSNGWQVIAHEKVLVDRKVGRRVNEIIVEKDGERRLVHFWYQSSRRSGMLGDFDQAVERIWGRILTGRADGSLVRLSAPLDARSGADRALTRSRLISFGQLLVPLLSEHWPRELPAEGAG